jgi:hypothetical protein
MKPVRDTSPYVDEAVTPNIETEWSAFLLRVQDFAVSNLGQKFF